MKTHTETVNYLMNLLYPTPQNTNEEHFEYVCLYENLMEVLEIASQKQIQAKDNNKSISDVEILKECVTEVRTIHLFNDAFPEYKDLQESEKAKYEDIYRYILNNVGNIEQLKQDVLFSKINLDSNYTQLFEKQKSKEEALANITKVAIDISMKEKGLSGIINNTTNTYSTTPTSNVDYNNQSIIENITEDQLKELLTQIVIPNSSIGIHGINSSGDALQVYESILEEGLRIDKIYGLVGSIAFENPTEELDAHNITSYYWQQDKNNKICNVIVAIPETGYISGEEYYIGQFSKYYDGYGKNDERANSIPLNNIKENLPKELIVGVLVSDTYTGKRDFMINNDYISFKSEMEQRQFSERLFTMANHLILNEDDYKFAQIMTSYPSNVSGLYHEKFIEKYKELSEGPKQI